MQARIASTCLTLFLILTLFFSHIHADLVSIIDTTQKYCGHAEYNICPLTFVFDSPIIVPVTISSPWFQYISSVDSQNGGSCSLSGSSSLILTPKKQTTFSLKPQSISCLFYLAGNTVPPVDLYNITYPNIAVGKSLSLPRAVHLQQSMLLTTETSCQDFTNATACRGQLSFPTTTGTFNIITSSKFTTITCSGASVASTTPTQSSSDSRLNVYTFISSTTTSLATCTLIMTKSPLSPYFYASQDDTVANAFWESRDVLYLDPSFQVLVNPNDCLANDTNLCTMIFILDLTSILTVDDMNDFSVADGFQHALSAAEDCSDTIYLQLGLDRNLYYAHCQKLSKYIQQTGTDVSTLYSKTLNLHGHAWYGKSIARPTDIPIYIYPLNVLQLDDCQNSESPTCTISFRGTHYGQGLEIVFQSLPYNANVQTYTCTSESSFDTFYRKMTIGDSTSVLSPLSTYSQWCNVTFALQPVNNNATSLPNAQLNPHNAITISLYRYGLDTPLTDISASMTIPPAYYDELPISFDVGDFCADSTAQNCTYYVEFNPIINSDGSTNPNYPRNFAIALPAQATIVTSYTAKIVNITNINPLITPTIVSVVKTHLNVANITGAGTIDYNYDNTADLTQYYIVMTISFDSFLDFTWDEIFVDQTEPARFGIYYLKTGRGEDYWNGTAFISSYNGLTLSNPYYDDTVRTIIFNPPFLPVFHDNCDDITQRFCSFTVVTNGYWTAFTVQLLNGYVSSFASDGNCMKWVLLSTILHRLVFDSSLPNCTVNLHAYYMSNSYTSGTTSAGGNGLPTKEFNFYYESYQQYTVDYTEGSYTNFAHQLVITPPYYWTQALRWYIEGPLTFDLCDDPSSPICYVNITIYNTFYPFDQYLTQSGNRYDRVIIYQDMPPTTALTSVELPPNSNCSENYIDVFHPYLVPSISATNGELLFNIAPGPNQTATTEHYGFGGGVTCALWFYKQTYKPVPYLSKALPVIQAGTVSDFDVSVLWPNINYNPLNMQPQANCLVAYANSGSRCSFYVTLSASASLPLYSFHTDLSTFSMPFWTTGTHYCFATQALANSYAGYTTADFAANPSIVASAIALFNVTAGVSADWFALKFSPTRQSLNCYVTFTYPTTFDFASSLTTVEQPLEWYRFTEESSYVDAITNGFPALTVDNSALYVQSAILYGTFAILSTSITSYNQATTVALRWEFYLAQVQYIDISSSFSSGDYSFNCYAVDKTTNIVDTTKIVAILHNQYSNSRLTVVSPSTLLAKDTCTVNVDFTTHYPTQTVGVSHIATVSVPTLDVNNNSSSTTQQFSSSFNYPVYVNQASS